MWLIIFYSNNQRSRNACQQAQPEMEKLAQTFSKGHYKVGAMDCTANTQEKQFCKQKGILGGKSNDSLPQYAFIVNGNIEMYQHDEYNDEHYYGNNNNNEGNAGNGNVPTARALHDFVLDHMPRSLIQNI